MGKETFACQSKCLIFDNAYKHLKTFIFGFQNFHYFDLKIENGVMFEFYIWVQRQVAAK